MRGEESEGEERRYRFQESERQGKGRTSERATAGKEDEMKGEQHEGRGCGMTVSKDKEKIEGVREG